MSMLFKETCMNNAIMDAHIFEYHGASIVHHIEQDLKRLDPERYRENGLTCDPEHYTLYWCIIDHDTLQQFALVAISKLLFLWMFCFSTGLIVHIPYFNIVTGVLLTKCGEYFIIILSLIDVWVIDIIPINNTYIYIPTIVYVLEHIRLYIMNVLLNDCMVDH